MMLCGSGCVCMPVDVTRIAPFSFFWHDYETFGRDPRHDWPAQFAGLRTDAELNPVGEPVMVHCRPPTDRLPDPESCLLTGITPQRCAADGLDRKSTRLNSSHHSSSYAVFC